MTGDEKIGNTGINYTSTGLGKIAYRYDEKSNSHIITTQGGTVIQCKTQNKNNGASIYLINDGDKEMLSLENIANAKIIASDNVMTKLSLIGCNGCYADMSRNNLKDGVSLWNSDRFKSNNNTVKIDNSDMLSFSTSNSEDEININSEGKYNEKKVQAEVNSLWHRIFGYTKID